MKKDIYPILTLRGLVVLPGNVMTFDVGRERSKNAIEEAMKREEKIFLIAQKNPETENPTFDDLYSVGTICAIRQIMRFSDERIRVIVEGLERAELIEITNFLGYIEGYAGTGEEQDVKRDIHAVLFKRIMDGLDTYIRLNKRVSADLKGYAEKYKEDLNGLIYETAYAIPFDYKVKQDILNKNSVERRGECLIDALFHEIDIINLEREIQEKVQSNIGKMQKDNYLREQMKVIRAELGEGSVENDADEYRKKAESLKFNEELYNKITKEINRLAKMPTGFAEANVIATYLDTVFELPWNIKSEENIDIGYAEEILNEDHYGLEKVKERILEYLAVRKMTGNLKGPVLCLVGPPGVGKTSIARSIARALNKKYVRMSLGGVKDESEIRGHRKTYVGAMPGRIISSIKQAGTMNPLILLDEIDKMSSDFRGDPSSAMLEVLDTEQNFSFRDHYLEFPFDLSEVLFICTANNPEGIPGPLKDRMEIIEVPSYTEEEKLQIAIRHLFPKQLKAHGLNSKNVKIEEAAVTEIIRCYTAEAGVRGLEREIAKICRKIARLFAEGKRKNYTVKLSGIEKLLGTRKRLPDKAMEKDEIGVSTGLAWTSIGGVTLNIEVNVMPGTGKLELTGHLGDVMKESAMAAMSFIRSRMEALRLDKDFYSKYDIHIHIPEGATPKDGPSAGITLATAMVSALTQIPCKKNVAMTGEITLRGRVLPIGGLKEKALAAYRTGVKTIIIPFDNIKDLEDIPENIRKDIKFVPVKNMDEVLETALSGFKQEFYCGIMNNNTPKGAYTYEHN